MQTTRHARIAATKRQLQGLHVRQSGCLSNPHKHGPRTTGQSGHSENIPTTTPHNWPANGTSQTQTAIDRSDLAKYHRSGPAPERQHTKHQEHADGGLRLKLQPQPHQISEPSHTHEQKHLDLERTWSHAHTSSNQHLGCSADPKIKAT